MLTATATSKTKFIYNDGGRAAAGYRGTTGDCVVRAIAIAAGIPYQIVYGELHTLAKQRERHSKRYHRSSPRNGVRRSTLKKYLTRIGWRFVPTMGIGSGCKVHLRADELPPGRLILSLSKHYAAFIDGVTHDLYDPSRDGTRCVYGYWIKNGVQPMMKASNSPLVKSPAKPKTPKPKQPKKPKKPY